MLKILALILAQRAKEPSTWAGLGSAVASGVLAAQTGSPEAIGAAVASLAAVVMPERGAK